MSVNVTVLMSVYNGTRYLHEAVDSILSQTFRDFEFLIIDDGSTDDTWTILQAYARQDSRVRILRQANAGLAQSLNNGLALAAGEIIVRMDADDVAMPERIARLLDYLAANPAIAAVGSNIQYIDDSGKPTHEGHYATAPAEVVKKVLEGHTPMAHPAVAMRKKAVLEVGGYRPAFAYAEDYDLWQRLVDRYQIANVPDLLLKYRIHGSNVSNVHAYPQMLSAYVARLSAQERHKGNPDPASTVTHLSISVLDRFEQDPHQLAVMLFHLTQTAVANYKASGDPDLLDEAEQCLGRLAATGGLKYRRLARMVAGHRLQQGKLGHAAGHFARGLIPTQHVSRAFKAASQLPADTLRNRRLAAALVHGADPEHLDTPPPIRLDAEDLRQLVHQATAHAVLPAVLRSLQPLATRVSDFDAATSDAATQARMLATHSMMLRGFADALLADLGGEPVTLIKGLTFARTIYPQPQLRPFTDIDLLIAPQAKPRVEEVLRARGFAFAGDFHDPARREDKWLHKQNQTLLVEVHGNMVHAPSLQKAVSLSYEDLATVGAGTPASHLMIATMHAALHQYESLRQVVDILQAARALSTPADEQKMENLVARTGGRLAAVAGLDLASRIFGEPRCREIARGLGPAQHGQLARLLINRNVVLSMTTERRVYYTWRRQGFRELLKRGRFVSAPSQAEAALKSHVPSTPQLNQDQ